ncbi:MULTISPECIES: VOC family protein [unclassified Mesorhizobium]|uniref:VOC family protein n=1 Tax=unclassified Mesorhizobium TaxID=325217 RepID=UPI000BAEA7EB|nr:MULTISPECIES: VOC family protein [unclassified Mesorhizobium]TGT60299.1 VOC family protein [Mesorhizobium sp. M00.F.Ca.ET.170.01.1.1]AZO12870.1 VOC family protein [Mesorhizobium sp. M3A.F.Ca.ET.080.04.2.1]PBB84717.1 hypothetical protein CK216_22300 [Mesorhizobium sp. WSM3876]RWB72327.1 MAG: VOC family protein [Mesorhizobium sp.]RWB89458.1 MAG: VOC family protein [Mesorhizobium sp.]
MIDHISLAVADLIRSKRFYDACLEPLGIAPDEVSEDSCSYESGGGVDFSIHQVGGRPMILPPPESHYAFVAPTREAVDRFFEAALSAGGRDDGPPGLRPEYHSDYYAAFVVDPDGHRIEAVCHLPDGYPGSGHIR